MTTTPQTSPSPASSRPRSRRTLIAVIGTAAGLVSMFTVLGIMALTSGRALDSQVHITPREIASFQRLRAENQALLSTYGVDQKTGQIRIPIERAMELIVNEHAASQPATGPTTNRPIAR